MRPTRLLYIFQPPREEYIFDQCNLIISSTQSPVRIPPDIHYIRWQVDRNHTGLGTGNNTHIHFDWMIQLKIDLTMIDMTDSKMTIG